MLYKLFMLFMLFYTPTRLHMTVPLVAFALLIGERALTPHRTRRGRSRCKSIITSITSRTIITIITIITSRYVISIKIQCFFLLPPGPVGIGCIGSVAGQLLDY